ncbi:L,D-transpeptidase [Gaiella sp.]|uniref:L,D-transpeptidase n=1 Tax=Gaiella sp. TaxID=2663207 RepID=UPI003983AE14
MRVAEARATPSVKARVVGRLTPRTPEGTTTIVPVFRRALRSGALWVEVGVPVLPNGTTGWVQRATLGGYGFVGSRLDISLANLRATLYHGSKRVFTAPIGVGRSKWPTPTGRFIIRNKLTKYASAMYGPLAFGTTARSAVLTDWPAGGFVGIHGTDQPRLIPGQISHGCIRLRNGDILRLARLMPIGTPVTIR